MSANCLIGRYRKYQGRRGLRSDREESQYRVEAVLTSKFALGAAGAPSESLRDREVKGFNLHEGEGMGLDHHQLPVLHGQRLLPGAVLASLLCQWSRLITQKKSPKPEN